MRVNFINVLAQFASGLGFNFLDLLETTGLDKGALSLKLLGKNLCELGTDVGEDVVGGKLK